MTLTEYKSYLIYCISYWHDMGQRQIAKELKEAYDKANKINSLE